MSDDKLKALQNLIVTPKDLNKLLTYERKLQEAITLLLFDCRNIMINAQESSKFLTEVKQFTFQIKTRIDALIDRARYDEMRFHPGTSDKDRKMIADNCILFNFIIFSKVWDLKDDLKKIDSLIVFKDLEKLTSLVRMVFENVQVIDELISSKNNIKTTVQSSEETVSALLTRFNKELELAESAGALKGIITLQKPKFLGKGKYYEQLGNIILKIVFSFGFEHSNEPISLRVIATRLTEDYPRVKTELTDIIKATELLAMNGFLILNQDREGLYWVYLKPSESEANVILALAEPQGYLTLEGLMIETGWSLDKANEELEKFVKAGCAIKDVDYSTGTKYYFPGLTEKSA
ncbi:MAG: hypothetical protein JXA54_15255 [Candidatus Heimdallarchaeota archaeon]|nr:hypothetical protein [Candidatus Heimdallarchaeota archaeon]